MKEFDEVIFKYERVQIIIPTSNKVLFYLNVT